MNNKQVQYVRYIVQQYLKDKPELEVFRQDLEQEGCLKYLQAQEDFDSSYGKDFNLFAFHRVHQHLRNYISRHEAKHFRKNPVDHESPYWDLNDPVALEEMPMDESRDTIGELKDILSTISLTKRQTEVLGSYLRTGSQHKVAEELGITQQYVSKILKQVISGCQKHC